jgi:hypothetical protein
LAQMQWGQQKPADESCAALDDCDGKNQKSQATPDSAGTHDQKSVLPRSILSRG